MRFFRFAVLALWSVALLFPLRAEAADKKSYTLAIVPQLRATEIYAKWTPFVKRLSQELGIDIQLTTYPSIPQFEADLLKGVPDFVYMNPYHVVMKKKEEAYIPLVKDKTPLVGILVAKKGGKVKSIKDLKGAEIAFPAPNAFAASLYMRALLTEQEKIKFTPLYVKTHSNVYRHVTLGMAGAGGGVSRTLKKEPGEIQDQLNVIYETPASASHPIAANPKLPASLRDKVVTAIQKLAKDGANKEMFENIAMPEPVDADYQKDYLPLKKLGLEKYVVLGDE